MVKSQSYFPEEKKFDALITVTDFEREYNKSKSIWPGENRDPKNSTK